jgi:hypothetical protein
VLPTTRTYTITQPAPAAPYTFRFTPDHFQAPDIAWDPRSRMFIGTPHTMRVDRQPATLANKVGNWLDEVSLIMFSPEGLTWHYVETNFMTTYGDRWPGVLCYPGVPGYGFEAKDPATRGTATYGRFLRDYRGNLVRTAANEVVWYYRGNWDDCFQSAAGALATTDFLTWRKVPGEGNPLFTPAGGRQFALGSALRVNGYVHLVHAAVDAQTCDEDGDPAFAGISFYLKKSDAPDAFSFSDGPGTFLFSHPSATVATCGSYAIDSLGQHHLAVDAKYGTICPPGATSCSEQDGVDMFTAVPR